MHVYTPRVPELVARVETLNERAISELTHHFRRCGKGGANPELVAMTIVHAVDAQLHRVVTGRADRVEEIVRLILKLSA